MKDFYGKKKAITFSYDDGVTQDIRLIELFNKYGLKCTFNLNSDLLGKPGELLREGVHVRQSSDSETFMSLIKLAVPSPGSR